MPFTWSAVYGSCARSRRPSAMSVRARAASEHQNATCHIMSRTAQPSAFRPGVSSRLAGTASSAASNAAQRSASARSSSSRRPSGLALRDELERHVADQHLVATPRARRGQLPLDALLDQPALQAPELDGIVQVGLGDPPLDAAADHAEALTLAGNGEPWTGGTKDDVRRALLDGLRLLDERGQPL